MDLRFIPRVFVAGTLFLLAADATLRGVEPPPANRGSKLTQERVREALQREVYGLSEDREKLLQAAANDEAGAQLPQWYLGRVQGADGNWKAADAKPTAREGQLYREYAALRSTKADDAASHKLLAD
ncbi:hypothetical protein [Anatilimnocola floriformis]|uniref:hypothetical protein n=1 Tax=Anatilimnocola floriformis TaxID=2948575 RepID=UPI0020C58C30|nr:hypothetical protein [Anatilimnocola floriformis]